MFTGIIQALVPVANVEKKPGLIHFSLVFSSELLKDLKLGASVSVSGVCQTVVKIQENRVWFDTIQETLDRTTLKFLEVDQQINVERAAKFGDEIGGHVLSGHVYGTVETVKLTVFENNHVVTFQSDPAYIKYLFPKGYVALDGASLTLVDVDPSGFFTVHLIPETLRLTTFGTNKIGGLVNIEFDPQTQIIVDTVERVLQNEARLTRLSSESPVPKK